MFEYKIKILVLGMLTLFYLSCEHPAPTLPVENARVSLNLDFQGENITRNGLEKSTIALSKSQFTQLHVRVFPSGTPDMILSDATPLATLEIDLAPGATEFAGELVVPAGSDRMFVVELFESDTDTTADGLILSYSGRKSGIKIEFGKINEIDMELYPVPIKNRRVVLWTESIEFNSTLESQALAIGIATLDSLRGIQFDLAFTPAFVRVAEVYPSALAHHFSDVLYNNTAREGTRFIFFDHQSAQMALPPVTDPGAIPTPLIEVLIIPMTENFATQQLIRIALHNGVVNTTSAEHLEVYAIPGLITFIQ